MRPVPYGAGREGGKMFTPWEAERFMALLESGEWWRRRERDIFIMSKMMDVLIALAVIFALVLAGRLVWRVLF